jgi:hypothetical protein
MLTRRALDYLATLQRDDPVPVSMVERMLIERGFEPYPAWLEFHAQFAGYWEPVGGSVAIWGLVLSNVSGQYNEPFQLYVTLDAKGKPSWVSCADVHPSFDYRLLTDGTFIGPPWLSASFAVKVERNALMWEFVKAGPARRVYDIDDVPITDLRESLLAELRPFHMPEASDQFANYYMSPDKLLLESLENDGLKLLIRAKE